MRGADTSRAQRLAWLARVLRWLQREGGYTLTALVRHRNQLCDVLLERLTAIAADARQRGFQLSFLGAEPRGCVSTDYVFRFGPGMYPARPPYYQGRYRFLKHYYGVIGDLKEAPPKQPDHEYHCAVAIDELPQVRHWVRNLPRFPEFSFWLPTSKDRFYPDFVAELKDGRLLVVEYKGEGYKTNDDSVEKRLIGEYWAKLTGNLFLFAVERDAEGRGVVQQLACRVAETMEALVEHQVVCVSRDIETDDGLLPAGLRGTVVSVYADGEACAVEFHGLAGGMQVLVLKREVLRLAGESDL